MKKLALLSLTSLFVLALAGSAWACHFDQVTPVADCEGWSIDGNIAFGNVEYADVDYSVQLMSNGSLVTEFTGSERIFPDAPYFSYADVWGMDLCGDYDVTVDLHLASPVNVDDEHFTTSFTCDCPLPPPEGCTRTPGYWKTHAEAWPSTEFTVGCVDYVQEEMLNILWMPTHGDMTIKLFHHLVAAKLNVLSGAPDEINDTIDLADDFLCDHPLFSKPKGALKCEATALKDTLDEYNNKYECDGKDDMDDMVMPASTLNATMPAQDSSSWGTMKASYRK